MFVRKYVNSQSGAALILVLFTVLFLSIVGTGLLNTTTYSLKSVVKNENNEAEFYLLEGALDIVLYNLSETINYYGGSIPLLDTNGKQIYAPDGVTPLKIHKKGTYFFLEDYFNNRLPNIDSKYKHVFDNIMIDGREIEFQSIETQSGNNYYLEISASYVTNPSMSRVIDLTVSIPNKPSDNESGRAPNRGDYVQVTGHEKLRDNSNIHQNQKPYFEGHYVGGIDFNAKKNKYGLSIPNTLRDLTNQTDIKGSIEYFDKIDPPNKKTIIIPENKIVYANTLNWIGQSRTLIVEGTLIVNSFHIQGSNTMEVKNSGTIIANHFSYWSNAQKTIFPSNNGGDPGNGGSTPQYTSDVNWISSKYTIDDYKTVR